MKKAANKLNGQDKIHQIITDAMIAKLEAGVIPWRKPWKCVEGEGAPANLVSKKPYRGVNVLLLGMEGYDNPYWVTFKQAKQLGGSVRKGEHGTIIIFWKWLDKKEKDDETGEESTRSYAMLRYYRVFNVEQCEGLDGKLPVVEVEEEEPEAIEICEAIWDGYSAKPPLTHGGNRAFYNPSADAIRLPKRNRFESAEKYYNTLFHEAIHSTGHTSRLAREEVVKPSFFGTHDYSKEELVAEMGAAFLCARAGIEHHTLDNSAAYIQGWLKKLKDDRRMVVQAAARAQKAVDWILDVDTHFAQ